MALQDLLQQLDELAAAAEQTFSAADAKDALEEARVEFLGAKNGRLKSVQKLMGGVAAADRPAAGKRLNEVKTELDQLYQSAKQRLAEGGSSVALERARRQFDVYVARSPLSLGSPSSTQPDHGGVEGHHGPPGVRGGGGSGDRRRAAQFRSAQHPQRHPARDPLENFYLSTAQVAGHVEDASLLLRSQTSTVQIRVMEQTPPPVRIISLGRVYRPDTPDATHYPMFHQMEGLLVDLRVTMADLKSVLRLFAASYLGGDVKIRFRPSFFPFTEPSVEVDFLWNDKWMEFGGAGMVDPNVLRSVGYDPEQVAGFAFGLGVERLCMRRHQITDIRDLYTNDVRFLRQF